MRATSLFFYFLTSGGTARATVLPSACLSPSPVWQVSCVVRLSSLVRRPFAFCISAGNKGCPSEHSPHGQKMKVDISREMSAFCLFCCLLWIKRNKNCLLKKGRFWPLDNSFSPLYL
jgi:hypothetical protein